MTPITDEQRAQNKAKRLRDAADPADGLTVRILNSRHDAAHTSFASRGIEPATEPNEFVVLSRDRALQAIKDGHAELAE